MDAFRSNRGALQTQGWATTLGQVLPQGMIDYRFRYESGLGPALGLYKPKRFLDSEIVLNTHQTETSVRIHTLRMFPKTGNKRSALSRQRHHPQRPRLITE